MTNNAELLKHLKSCLMLLLMKKQSNNRKCGGSANLSELYDVISQGAQEKAKSNPNWKAKVRQTLQNMVVNVERGVWELRAAA